MLNPKFPEISLEESLPWSPILAAGETQQEEQSRRKKRMLIHSKFSVENTPSYHVFPFGVGDTSMMLGCFPLLLPASISPLPRKRVQWFTSMNIWWFNPSEKYESQLGLIFPIYGKIKFMFQTTNQTSTSSTSTGVWAKATKVLNSFILIWLLLPPGSGSFDSFCHTLGIAWRIALVSQPRSKRVVSVTP